MRVQILKKKKNKSEQIPQIVNRIFAICKNDSNFPLKNEMEDVLVQFTRTNHYFTMRFQVENRNVFDADELKKFKELEKDLRSWGYIK